MEIEQCRLCMIATPKGLLNLKTDKTGEIILKINTCLNYQVSLENDLPHCICRECYMKVLDFCSFQAKCLENESAQRSSADIQGSIVMSKNVVQQQPARLQARQTLNDKGLVLLRQNICNLNDKIASLNQEKDLLHSKITTMQQENDALKTSILQHSKTLPQITKTMSSLLSRMEQQFLFSNSRILEGNLEEDNEGPEPQEVEPQECEQMDTQYNNMMQWSESPRRRDDRHSSAVDKQPPPPSQQVTYEYCDPMIEHITEVEINCDPQPVSPARGDSGPPSPYDDDHVPVDTEVNALLVQLCEQQERAYDPRRARAPAATPAQSPHNTRSRKTEHYELVVPRRPFVNSQ